MQYQHLVFEEFARKVRRRSTRRRSTRTATTPALNPAIAAEFAHVVYRFGHSMLTEDIGVALPDGPGVRTSPARRLPQPAYLRQRRGADPRAGGRSVISGTTNQVGSQIDEHVIDTLRNKLLGLPLDLATINMARARDTGVPPLHRLAGRFFEASGDPMLGPTTTGSTSGWHEERRQLRSRVGQPSASLVNFVAAYGKHPTHHERSTVVGKRDAADLIVNGGAGAPADRVDFMNGTGDWADQDGDTVTGLEEVDFWMGGLAEELEPFGGMLGSTFNYVFERQLEDLQFGDRFYYLFRNQGNQLFAAARGNSFSGLIQRNTDATLLPADIFAVQDPFIDLDEPARPRCRPASCGCRTGPTAGTVTSTSRSTARRRTAEHDKIRGGQGDDSLWGYAGDDRIEGGSGNDSLIGGAGNDILTDTFGDDNIKGGCGQRRHQRRAPGDDLILGGHGHDFVITGSEFKTVFAGTGRRLHRSAATVATPSSAARTTTGSRAARTPTCCRATTPTSSRTTRTAATTSSTAAPATTTSRARAATTSWSAHRRAPTGIEGMLGFDWVTYRGRHQPTSTWTSGSPRCNGPTTRRSATATTWSRRVSGGDGDDVLRGHGSVASTTSPLSTGRR